MDPSEAVVARYQSVPHVAGVIVPTEEEIARIFAAEGEVKSGSGMVMRNDSLTEAMRRTHHIVVVQDADYTEGIPYHAMTWETEDGTLVGFDVPDSLRHEVEGRDDLIWISDDFVMLPVVSDDDMILVMHPTPVGTVGEEQGVKDAIGLYVAAPVDDMIRGMYGIDRSGKLSTCVVSFNMI